MRACAVTPGIAAEASGSVAKRASRRLQWAGPIGLLAVVASAAGVTLLPGLGSMPALVAPQPAHVSSVSSASTWAGLSPLEQSAISRGIGQQEPAYWATRSVDGLRARNEQQGLAVQFARSGVTVATAAGILHLRLDAVTAGAQHVQVSSTAPTARANRVSYARAGLTEWYANGPAGLEQGFTVARPSGASAAATMDLSLRLQTAGLRGRVSGTSVSFLAGRRAVLRYDGLMAVGADGRRLPAWITLRGFTLVLHVRATGNDYPVRVDPVVQDAQLLAADGQAGDGLGQSVAVSGPVVAVGAPLATIGAGTNAVANAGAVYVFTKPAGGWIDANGAVKLTNADPQTGDSLGYSVAISGTTILAGASDETVAGHPTGAVVYFDMPAAGWTSETDTGEIVPPTNAPGQGFGFSIAADGNTLAVGAPFASNYSGQIYVYNEPAGGWADESPTASLSTTSPGFTALGQSVAISGSTIVAGEPFLDPPPGPGVAGPGPGTGQVAVYAEPPSGWVSGDETAQLTECLAACPQGIPTAAAGDFFGEAVSVSGSTIVATAPGETVGANAGQGAAYVFSEPSGGWTSATSTIVLTAADGAAGDGLGSVVSISGSSIVAASLAPASGPMTDEGRAYVFDEPTSGWATATSNDELGATTGQAGDGFGSALAISGSSLVIGAEGATIGTAASQGAAYEFEGVSGTPFVSTNGATTTTTSASTTTSTAGATPATPVSTTTTSDATSRTATPAAVRNYATVTSITGGPGLVLVSLRCTATTGKCSAANVNLVLEEKFSGRRLVGTTASTKLRFERVVVGAGHITLAGGARAALKVYLNPTGHKLLGAQAHIATGVSVTSVGRTLRLATVTINRGS